MINNKSIFKYHMISIISCIVLGALFHFTYNWSNCNNFVAIFSSINESTWEHLKLAFSPWLFLTFIGYLHFSNNQPNFLCSRIVGILTTITFITIFFYSYTGIIGKHFIFLDIGSFIIGIILGEYISYKLMLSDFYCYKSTAFFILTILVFYFIFFSFYPPHINLFKDPISGLYGRL